MNRGNQELGTCGDEREGCDREGGKGSEERYGGEVREGDQHRVGGRVEGGDEGEGCERRELACITASGVFGCTAFIILTINFADANNG